jgi:hypothetical protein
MRASDYMDVAARLTPRQAAFYRNLIRIAAELGSEDIPVEFELPNGHAVYLDRGCIKIAEHAGFIELLRDGASGNVETIRLTWRVNPRAL